MRLRNPKPLITGLAVLLAACGAPPEFTATLSDPGTAAEVWVEGRWYSLPTEGYFNESTAAFASVESLTGNDAGEGPFYRFMLHLQGEGPLSFGFTGFPSRVGEDVFYNLTRIRAPRPDEPEERPVWVRGEGAFLYDYTPQGIEPGTIIARLLQPAPDTMLVCVLFLYDIDNSGGYSPRLVSAIERAGMTGASREVEVHVNGAVLMDGENPESGTYTRIHGSRDALRALVQDRPGENFYPAFLFRRLGTTWRAPAEDPELAQQVLGFSDDCNVEMKLED